MVYALNLFDIKPGQVSLYRQYASEAGRVIFGLGGRVICSGWHPRTVKGEEIRSYLIVVEFPDREAYEFFLNHSEHEVMHRLREESTCNYIWKVFEPWDLQTWLAFPGKK